MGDGHRVVLSRVTSAGLFENHAVAVFRSATTPAGLFGCASYTIFLDANDRGSGQANGIDDNVVQVWQ